MSGRVRATSWLLGAMIAWSALAAGGVYAWARGPVVLASAVLLALAGPPLLSTRSLRTASLRTPDTGTLDAPTLDTRTLDTDVLNTRMRETGVLDASLLVALAGAALTAVPLPRAIVSAVTPHRDALVGALTVGPRTAAAWDTISLDAGATAYSVALAAAAVAVFWACRQLCGTAGARPIVRAVAATGLLVAVAALVQPALDPQRLYGLWSPLDEGARPFGPFVNRNHFATWALLAMPLSVGYAVATLSSRRTAPTRAAELASWGYALGSRSVWAMAAAGVLALGLVVSGSRSGMLAFGVVGAVGLGLGLRLGRRRLTPRAGRWAAVGVLALAAFLVAYASAQPLLSRAEETLLVGAGDRPQIWRDAVAVIRDFWVSGTGPGTFATTMLVYQETDRGLFTNHAHNHYLQLAAEGGVVVIAPLTVAVVVWLRLFLNRLRRDDSSQIWMRVGGAAGIAGVAVQSCFETGLRLPGNAVLFAVAAAVAVHRPRRRTPDATQRV